MKSTIFFLLTLFFLSCGSEQDVKLSRNDSLNILNRALADRVFLQEQLSHKRFDTIYFVKGTHLPQNANLEQSYFRFFYIDSTAINTRASRIFYERDPRIRIGIEKFQLKQDTVFLTLKNYGAEFYYLFKFKKDKHNWGLISASTDTGY